MEISKKIIEVNREIKEICKNLDRDAGEITILGASKSQSLEKIKEALENNYYGPKQILPKLDYKLLYIEAQSALHFFNINSLIARWENLFFSGLFAN